MKELIWIIPLLPFMGALLNGVFLRGRISKKAVAAIACGAVGLACVLSIAAIGSYMASAEHEAGEGFQKDVYLWIPAGDLMTDDGPKSFELSMGFLLDPLSCVMLFVVTFVGFLIHWYSVGYMSHEEGYQRYFTYLNLFMGAMLLLILGSNYLVMFVGWEGVGLCSYLLIGFYFKEEFPPYAGRKAFIVNRIGDFAFLVALFALVAKFGTLDFQSLFGAIAAHPESVTGDYLLGLTFAGFVTLCLFVGAMGKSAQIPLYVWLPDAMAGPTPVSALIHAATMVTAGVYMVVRSNVLYQLAPGTSLFVATVGAATALFAATIALRQNDIKKVLAYSTVSQLGYMFLAAGVGAYVAAVFHLATHAFFKALLFLGSGSVIHAMGGEQDMHKMGALKKWMPVTFRTYFIATLAIAGVPFLSGFFSKDEILAGAANGGHWILYGVALVTAGMTAFYMFRSVCLTFFGEFRGTDEQRSHLHESPSSMTWPLMILAVGAVLAGYAGVPKVMTLGNDWNWLHHFLDPVIAVVGGHGAGDGHGDGHHLSAGVEWALIGLSVAVALTGLFLAWRLYGKRGTQADESFAARVPGVARILENKYYVDEAYQRLIVAPLAWLSRMFWKVVDSVLIDGSIHVGAFLTELTGDLGRFSTTGNVRNYALYFFLGLVGLLGWLLL